MGEVIEFPQAQRIAQGEADRAIVECERAEAIMSSVASRINAVIAELEHELSLMGQLSDLAEISSVCAELERERAELSAALLELKAALAGDDALIAATPRTANGPDAV